MIIPVLVSSVVLFIIILFVSIYKAIKFMVTQFFGLIKTMNKKNKFELTATAASLETKSLMSKISHTEN